MYLVHTGHPSDLGRVEGIGKGTGILGALSLVVYLAAKIVTPEKQKEDDPKKPKRNSVMAILGLILAVTTGFVSARTAATLKQQLAEKNDLSAQIAALQRSRGDLLDFLHGVSQRENLHFVDKNVSDEDWRAAVSTIEKLPPGQRKKTIYGAILLAWQNIPLNLKNTGVANGGVDSANFWRRVFRSVGIEIETHSSERVSDAMKRLFSKTDSPLPGDLLFYQGAEKTSVGNFVMMYLGPGKNGGSGICLGTYDAGKPVEVIDAFYFDEVNPPDHLIGKYRPNYVD